MTEGSGGRGGEPIPGPGVTVGPEAAPAGVAGIVAAAGASTRMGRRNKLLMEVGGEAMVRRVVATALQAGLDPVVVVTGHDREAVEAALADLPCRFVHNPEHMAGLHSSVAAGVSEVASRSDRTAAVAHSNAGNSPEGPSNAGHPPNAAVVMLADMPFVTAEMLRALIARHRRTGALAVASRYRDGPTAPPVLYDRRLFGELAVMDAGCGRGVVRRHRQEVVVVEWPVGAGRDVDRPEHYRMAHAALAGDGHGPGDAVSGGRPRSGGCPSG